MAWQRRWLAVVALSGCLMSGCAQLPDWAVPEHSPALDITPTPAPQVRGQMGDVPQPLQIPRPMPFDAPNRPAPSSPPAPSGIQQASYAKLGAVKVRVCAWVNGAPIFEDEVQQIAGVELERIRNLSPAQRSAKTDEILHTVIENLMDQEVIYQDAVKRIKKSGNPHALDKLKEYVDLEYDKAADRLRRAKPPVPEYIIKAFEPAQRRLLERNLISGEYIRSRTKDTVEALIGLVQIKEYYEEHLNEFKSVDKIDWQDIYIPLNQNHPTFDKLKQFGEQLVNSCLAPDDFNKLIVYDALKNGEGHGNLRGDIRPMELEPILFALEPGKIGPVVPLGSGIHLIRVRKREYDGQLPLNEEVAKTIRRKLEGEVRERLIRSIVRELRARAVCRIERNEP